VVNYEKRSFLFVFARILLLLAGIYFVNEARGQEMVRENARIANETKQHGVRTKPASGIRKHICAGSGFTTSSN
jgi:sulfite exporter TauE/SafE